MEQYLEYRENLGYSIKTVDSLRILDRYMMAENVTTFEALTPLFFLKMRTDLAIDPNTINKVIYGLRGFFQYLVRIGFCQYNPLTGIPRFKENNIIPFIFSDQETEQLLEAAWKQIRKEKQDAFSQRYELLSGSTTAGPLWFADFRTYAIEARGVQG